MCRPSGQAGTVGVWVDRRHGSYIAERTRVLMGKRWERDAWLACVRELQWGQDSRHVTPDGANPRRIPCGLRRSDWFGTPRVTNAYTHS